MRVIRRCLRTKTIFIAIWLRIDASFVLNFFWNRLLFCEFFQARILPEKLFVGLERVHTRILFIQQFLNWVGLLGTLKTEETQVRPADNGRAT
jgi:hypothetical protein